MIVGVNQSFQVGNHDFSKMSIIRDAVFVQNIPENHEEQTNVLRQEGIANSLFQARSIIHLKIWLPREDKH